MDPRVKKLACVLVDYSVKVKKGEIVQISSNVEAKDLILEIYRLVIKKGAYPLVSVGLPGMSYIYFKNASTEQLKKFPRIRWHTVQKTDKYISIGAEHNTRELTSINPEKIAIRDKVTRKITDYIANEKQKIRRVTTAYPTGAYAQEAGMSLEEYEDFVFNAINRDWKKVEKRMLKIKKIFDKGSEVKITGKDTDITLGIKGRKMMICAGEENMPDGEICCAPLENKTNGKIKFTYPSIRDGKEVADIRLEFKNGKVVKASASKNEAYLKEMLKLKGVRIVGELGVGCNYKIDRFTNNLLFDEKIGGTIHLALGSSYKECEGKNQDAAIHWDIVKDLRKNGKIYVDGKLIQKNGKFLI